MQLSLFRIVHMSVLRRATNLNYPGNIPIVMNSLRKNNPTQEEIKNDYCKLAEHFQHPVFSSWIPTYDELIENRHFAWLKRYTSK